MRSLLSKMLLVAISIPLWASFCIASVPVGLSYLCTQHMTRVGDPLDWLLWPLLAGRKLVWLFKKE